MLAVMMQRFTSLDILLIVILCLVVPAVQVARSLDNANREGVAPLRRVLRTMVLLGLPLILLALDWLMTGRRAAVLGLATPVPLPGQIGFGVAGMMILALLATSYGSWIKSNAQREAEFRGALEKAGMLVRTPIELAAFVALAFVIGCGAEILFRGFLLWAFAPLTGTFAAVVIAALAYGVGHGHYSWRQAAGSIVASFAFTIGYAATQSLWWLMLFHTFVAVHGTWRGYRLSHEAESTQHGIALASGDRL